jgi:hypothetical protein
MVPVGGFDAAAEDEFAVTSPIRLPVPDVVIGGAPRSGTTFLCEVLAKHPGVFVARPFIPEPKVLMTPHPDGDAGLLQRYAEFFAEAPADAVRVEKTSYMLENDEARDRLVRLLPHAKLVFILREPVARAYSNWLWSRKNGLETLSFRDAIAAEGKRQSPLPPDREYARPFDYMTRARYAHMAEGWIKAIGRERIAVYIFEDAIAHPEPFIASLQDFVGVERLPWDRLATGVVNANDPVPAALDAATIAELRERIGDEMRCFAELTGLDVGIWGY